MKKLFIIFALLVLVSVPCVAQAAFEEQSSYMRARVLEVTDEGTQNIAGGQETFQVANVEILQGDEKGTHVTIEVYGINALDDKLKLKPGETIVISRNETPSGPAYNYINKYRLPALYIVGIFFVALVLVTARLRGITSLLGLAVSIFILGGFIVPRILAGDSPLLITAIGAIGILIFSLFLTHGFNRLSVLAFASAALTLLCASALAVLFVSITHIFGAGSEGAVYLQFEQFGSIDIRGLFLGGVIIGTLGVLDDICTSQIAAVKELYAANTSLTWRDAYRRASRIGREHIAALVNTLVLAYAGAGLPIFLIFSQQQTQPLWLLLNSDPVAEEIVRTLVGSSALVIAVPLSTLIGARFLRRSRASTAL